MPVANPTGMVTWELVPGIKTWILKCVIHPDAVYCEHIYRKLDGTAGLPTGIVRLPQSAEFPTFPEKHKDTATTVELASFRVEVSDEINKYGTRTVSILRKEEVAASSISLKKNWYEQDFLCTLQPEDTNWIIYQAADELAKATPIEWSTCVASTHQFSYQKKLDALLAVKDDYPVIGVWNTLSYMTEKRCLVCMIAANQSTAMPGFSSTVALSGTQVTGQVIGHALGMSTGSLNGRSQGFKDHELEWIRMQRLGIQAELNTSNFFVKVTGV